MAVSKSIPADGPLRSMQAGADGIADSAVPATVATNVVDAVREEAGQSCAIAPCGVLPCAAAPMCPPVLATARIVPAPWPSLAFLSPAANPGGCTAHAGRGVAGPWSPMTLLTAPASPSAAGFMPPSYAGTSMSVAPLAHTAVSQTTAMALAASRVAAAPQTMHSGEACLLEMLTTMDMHMVFLRAAQQALVGAIEGECRQVLGDNFGKLVLVGSAALGAETPGSDVDVVCFTRRHADRSAEAPGLSGVDILRRVHAAFATLAGRYPDATKNLATELIDEARVPIMRVVLGTVAVDLSINQDRPLAHVRWAQKIGAAPHPSGPTPPVAPLVTVLLRGLKWWLKRRRIPRAKEGCLPTLAWLMLAVHVCSLRETCEQVSLNRTRPMATLLVALGAFFRRFAAPGSMDGLLQFAPDGSSEFLPHTRDHYSPWSELSVMDPTYEGAEGADLSVRLQPATQLLLAYELRRAAARLPQGPTERWEAVFKDGHRQVSEVFEQPMEGINLLPTSAQGIGILVLVGSTPSDGIGCIEVAILERTVPRPGWMAMFLHRGDKSSELHVQLFDVEERTGRCHPRRKGARVLCPANFVCRVQITNDGWSYTLDKEGLQRLRGARQYIGELGGARRSSGVTRAAPLQGETSAPSDKHNEVKAAVGYALETVTAS
eukprot:TRINITY_DN3393_c1_g1_i1.p1 TRINITY_DN3393_c1_g1~~TRINITY_DN3393_c1_g1_i1.p1  ORF type:complete len:661 (-),score=93.20 TRINITY_DN3393_c1_g1_i1:603-2585(-)